MSPARRARRIAFVLFAAASLLAALLGQRRQREAESESRASLRAGQVAALVKSVSHGLDAGDAKGTDEAIRELERALRTPDPDRRTGRPAGPGEHQGAAAAFLTVARDELRLLVLGDRDALWRLDAERGDPLARGLEAQLLRARVAADQRARVAAHASTQAFWVSLVFAVAGAAYLLWVYGRTRLEAAATERARATSDRSLRESEERFRLLFEGNPQPMFLYDRDTLRFVEVNQAAVQHYGWSREEFLAMTIADIRPPEDVPALRRAVAEPSQGPHDSGVWRHHKKDGTPLYVEVRSFRMIQGGRRLALALLQDVSERHRLEEELRQAQKMEAVGRLAGGVAHDFNNLITAVQGYSELLLREVGHDEQLRGWCEEVLRASQRASSLTRQLLAFSRKQVVRPEVVDLNGVLVESHKILMRLLGEDIDLVTAPQSGLGRVLADVGQVQQVILNLAVNARDAMPGGGMLTIETSDVTLDRAYTRHRADLVPGPYVMLAVTDTGTGMTPEVKARLFEPFFTTKEPGKGTGLGLATVYGIVKGWGGTVSVYSEVGQGTTIKIYLPRVEGTPATEPSPAVARPDRGTETILLVEDEVQVRDLARRVLEGAGYAVHAAPHGSAALEVAAGLDRPVDLLLTDVVMPGMRGWELSERLRTRVPGLRVLFMSGYPDDASLHHGLVSHEAALLAKPYSAHELLRAVRDALDAAD